MSNTLSRELETVLQLDNWGLVAPDITVLGFEFAQNEIQQLQESVPTDVFSLENNTSILQLLTKPNDITVYTDAQYIDIMQQCYRLIQAQTIASKISTFPYADGSKMVDIQQYHECNFAITGCVRTVSAFAIATLYISGTPKVSVLFGLIV